MNKKLVVTIAIALVISIILILSCTGKKSTGEESTSGGESTKWYKEGAIYETHPYYYPGHSIKEITDQIPSLSALGIKTIYLMPIFKHEVTNPPYNFIYIIIDYYQADPAYGTEADLQELVDKVHAYNMKIVFDMVTAVAPPPSVPYQWTLRTPLLNLGSDLIYQTVGTDPMKMYEGTFVYSPECLTSSLCSFGGKLDGSNVILYTYPNPKFGAAVDRTNSDVISYFTGVASYYVTKYNIDGWRLDSTYNTWNPTIIQGDHSMIPLAISMKSAITQIKPNAIFIAEHPSMGLDATSELSYMSYDQFKAIGDGLVTGTFNSLQLVDALKTEKIGYSGDRVYFGETHDSPRDNAILTNYNQLILVLISTIPGVPMIQAGQEIGAKNDWFFSANSDPKVSWSFGDYNLRDFYQKVFTIRNSNDAIKYGTFENVWKSGDNTYAYVRSYNNKRAIIILNFMDKPATSTLNLPFFQSGTILYDELNNENIVVNDPNNFITTLPAYGSKILLDII